MIKNKIPEVQQKKNRHTSLHQNLKVFDHQKLLPKSKNSQLDKVSSNHICWRISIKKIKSAGARNHEQRIWMNCSSNKVSNWPVDSWKDVLYHYPEVWLHLLMMWVSRDYRGSWWSLIWGVRVPNNLESSKAPKSVASEFLVSHPERRKYGQGLSRTLRFIEERWGRTLANRKGLRMECHQVPCLVSFYRSHVGNWMETEVIFIGTSHCWAYCQPRHEHSKPPAVDGYSF